MRKLIAALTAVGLGLTIVRRLRADGRSRPPPGHQRSPRRRTPQSDHELPEPARGEAAGAQGDGAHRRPRAGERQPEERNGSTVVKVGERRDARPAAGRREAATATSTSSSSNEAHRQGLHAARRVRQPARTRDYPDQDTDPDTPGRPASTGRCTTRSPSPTARSTTRRIWQPDFSQRVLPGPLLRYGQGRRVAEDLLREAVLGPLLGRRRGHRLGQGPLQRGPLRPLATASRATTSSATTPGTLVKDGMNAVGRRPAMAAGRTPAQIQAELATYDV